ncbi:MAG: cell division protein [Archaeoglobaceae archaeon]|nr:cell division protein [Archaeoglobaceae archaeon]MDW7989473.1 cell division protein [Archaeoglobaceae archaeon]
MKLLTIGIGLKGAKVVENFYRKGIKVNRAPLFKCFAILGDESHIRTVKMRDDRKFYAPSKKSVPAFLNSITRIYELWEGGLIIFSIEDEYSFELALEINEKIREVFEDPIMSLLLIPTIEKLDLTDLKKKILEVKKKSDILLLFEGKVDFEEKILKSLNLLALAGEVDLKRRVAGEVVVDTSDVFNALKSDGFSVIGFAEKKIPIEIFKKKNELKARRTKRIIDLYELALQNLSVLGNIEEASSSLVLFSGPKEEITMEGIFEVIGRIEKMNQSMEIRYGDCPLQSRKVSLIVLFSGIKSLKLQG